MASLAPREDTLEQALPTLRRNEPHDMDISGSRLIPAPRAAVWAALGDPDVVSACLPGCERLTPTPEGGYAGAAAAKVGPLRTLLTGKAVPTDVEPGRRVAFAVSAEDEKAGSGEGEGEITLADEEGGTLLAYQGRFEATGKIAQLGPRLVGGFARQTVEQAIAKLAEIAADGRLPEAAPLAPDLTPEPAPDAGPARTLDETPPLVDEGPVEADQADAPAEPPEGAAVAEAPVPPMAETPIAPTATPAVPDPVEIAAAEAADPKGSGVMSRVLLVAAVVIVVGFFAYVGLLQPPR